MGELFIHSPNVTVPGLLWDLLWDLERNHEHETRSTCPNSRISPHRVSDAQFRRQSNGGGHIDRDRLRAEAGSNGAEFNFTGSERGIMMLRGWWAVMMIVQSY